MKAKCDFHHDVHPSTHWCHDCEQGMCGEAYTVHSLSKASKNHKVTLNGTQPPAPQILCELHGRELELVCEHTSHPPKMICFLCVTTTHNSHTYVTTADHLKGRQAEIQTLMVHAKQLQTMLVNSAQVVDKEHAAVAACKEKTKQAVHECFTRIKRDLDTQLNNLLATLDATTSSNEQVLRKQKEGMQSTNDELIRACQQLEAAQHSNSYVEVLNIVTQLQQHVQSIKEMELHPQVFAEMIFEEAPFTLPSARLLTTSASITTTNKGFPITLSTTLPLTRFDISCTWQGKEQKMQVTKAEEGFAIQPELFVAGDVIVQVKLEGQHVKGSPVFFVNKHTWSTHNNKVNITGAEMKSTSAGGWGMVAESFGMLSHKLVIKVDHEETNKWAQIALYNTNTAPFKPGNDITDSLAFHNTWSHATIKAEKETSLWELTREEDQQVSLRHDGKLVWKVAVPTCYVYVDIYNPPSTAEIIQ